MSIRNQRELAATRAKLNVLEERYAVLEQEQSADNHVRELTMRSLKSLINQLKEEIVRFEVKVSPGSVPQP